MAIDDTQKIEDPELNLSIRLECESIINDLGLEKNESITGNSSPRGEPEGPVLGRVDSDDHSSNNCSSSSTTTTTDIDTDGLERENLGPQWRTMIDSIKKKKFSVIPLLTSYETTRKNLRRKMTRPRNTDFKVDCEGLIFAKPSWRNFSFDELSIATDNFNSENLIGEGGHAEVYRGCLPDGKAIAVKRLISNETKEEEDRISDFLSELGIIAHVNHPNAARLIGFSTDRGLHLILEFSPHGSLETLLFGSKKCLEWKTRYKVAVGIADGLQYLHHECQRRIIHRDIKPSNILLTEDYEAQISDFGLAKWLPENWAHHIVFPIEGTFGYLAPEYFMHGIVDEKTDIFAFGVLLLELITGREAVDTSSRQSLVMWAKPLLETDNVIKLVDPLLQGGFDAAEMKRVMLTASMCIHHLATMRPDMNRVIQLIRGDTECAEKQQKSKDTEKTVNEEGTCDLQDYTCTTYLNEISRHKQLMME